MFQRPSQVLANNLKLCVDRRVEQAAADIVTDMGEVEMGKFATKTVGGLIVRHGRLFRRVEGAKPEASAIFREADFGDPLAPVPLPHPAVELGRLRRQGGGAGELHGLRSRGEEVAVMAELELSLDLLDLCGSEVSEGDVLIRAQEPRVGDLGV